MFYRLRIYRGIPEHLDQFHAFFYDWLLPVQVRYGARLVGRWVTEDHRVVAVWEYNSREDYERIQPRVAADPDSVAAQAHRRAHLPDLFTHSEETFMTRAPHP